MVLGNNKQFDLAADRQLLTVKDVGRMCSVSTRVVYRWIADDDLPVHLIPGAGKRPIQRIDRCDLDHWLKQFCHELGADHDHSQQTILLKGRRFIKSSPSFLRRKNRLDTGAAPDSRVARKGADDDG